MKAPPPAGDSAGAPGIDEGDVLAPVSRSDVSTMDDVAKVLKTSASQVEPVITKLSKDGCPEAEGAALRLSSVGERALRYISMAR
jgi:predicted transcriptional regulator